MLQKLRALSSDTLVYGVSTILGRFLTFLLTPLYTNYLSAGELGDTAYLYSLIAFVNVLYSFGFDSAFFKFFKTGTAQPSDSSSASNTASNHASNAESSISAHEEHNRSVFAHSFLAISVISGVSTFALCLAAEPLAHTLSLTQSTHGSRMIAYSAIIAFLDALTLIPYAALRMERRSKRFAGTKFAVIALNVAANLVLVVWLKLGMNGVFLAGVCSSFVSVVLVLPECKRYLASSRVRFDAALLREMRMFGFPTVPAAFSAIVLQVIDRPIMKLLTDAAAVGMYQANYRLGIPMMLAVTVFEYAWKPFYLRETSSAHKSRSERHESYRLLARILTYFTLVCCVVFLLAGLLIEYLVRMPFIGGRFINPAYWSGLGIIPIVLGGYYFNGMFANFAASVYIRKRTKYLPKITSIAAVANVVLNFALIPLYGIWGAAWATLGAYCVMAAAMYAVTRRIYPLQYEWGRILHALLLTLAIFFGMQFLTAAMKSLLAIFLRMLSVPVLLLLLMLTGFFRAEERAFFTKLRRRISS